MSELKDRGALKKEGSDAKKHFARLEDQQDQTLADKDRASTLAKRLKVRGTREGADSVESAVEKAGADLDQLGEAQKRSHERAARRGEQTERELQKKARVGRQDERAAFTEAAQIHDAQARRQIEGAAKAAEKDSVFLDDLKKEREKVRSKSETDTEKRIAKIKAARVDTRRKGGGGS